MSTRSLQDQINALLKKNVAMPKVGGAPSPDVETASVVESLALAFMLQPRAALYAHYLAKGALSATITREVEAIETLKVTIQDLANTTYAIKSTADLKRAQAAMLQLSTQGQLSSDSNAFSRYSSAIDDFLNKQLARNVKRPGATDLVRPGEEAGNDLPSDLTALKELHTEFLDRLYALAVGVTNFANTPFGSIVGSNAVYRAKKDLDNLILELEQDDSGSQSREAVIRLLGSRATIRTVGKTVELSSAVVDSARHLPLDKQLYGQSVPTPAVAQTAAGPFVLTNGGSLTVAVGGVSVAASSLNQAQSAAAVLGEAIPGSVLVPANFHLFLRLEATDGLTWTGPVNSPSGPTDQGTYSETTLGSGWVKEGAKYFKVLRVVLNSGDPSTSPPGSASPLSLTLATVLSRITTALGAFGSAVEFVGTGLSSRILIVASEPKIQSISVVLSSYEMEPQSAGYATSVGATVYFPRLYTNSFHEELGFGIGQSGEKGNTPTDRLLAAMNIVFSSLVTCVQNADETITITSLATSPGTVMSFSGSWATDLTLSASYSATSNEVQFVDENGDVVSPIGFVDVSDVLSSDTGAGTISSLAVDRLTLSAEVPTFSGNVEVVSSLFLTWQVLDSSVSSFLSTWIDGPFAENIESIDRVIAVLIGSPTSPRRSEALGLLDQLKAYLLSLQSDFLSAGAILPTGSCTKERAVINNAISTFTERKYDRALDLLLRCQIQEMFEVDWQTASYSGNLMKAAENVARSDVRFPDTSKDEGFDVIGRRDAVR